MVTLGVSIAIIDAGKLLLTKREDFEVWCLPGGEVDPNESLAQTALREAWEETGVTVQLTRLVGIYSIPHWGRDGQHSILFAAKPTGGSLCLCPGETIDVGYFAFDQLPADLIPWHRQKIRDVINGIGGSATWRQDIQWQFAPGMSRKEIYAERDRSGLARSAFFWRQFRSIEPLTEVCEVEEQSSNHQP